MLKKVTSGLLVCAMLILPFFPNGQPTEKEGSHQEYLFSTSPHNSLLNDSPVVWMKTFGGRGNDLCYSLDTTVDGESILVGETSSFGAGGSDVWLVKVNDGGQEEWNKTYGGLDSDYGLDGHQTNDQGYILVGGTSSYGAGSDDVWLIKTDKTGTKLWDRTFGGADFDQGYAVKQVSDGGYIICGGTKSYGNGPNDYWVIRTDQNGQQLWNITYGLKGYDWGYDIIETHDHGFVFTGGTDTSLGGTHILDIGLIKVNQTGVLQWAKTFNKPPAAKRWDEGYGVIQTADDGFIIAGIVHTYSWDDNGTGAGWIIKTDANGKKQWDTTYGGENNDCLCSIQATADGGYILSGWTCTYGEGSADLWFMKTDAQGIDEWDMTLGGDAFDWAMFHTVRQTADQQYLLAGTIESNWPGGDNVLLVKLGEPLITIESLGKRGFSWRVKNTGEEDLSNVNWSVHVHGLIMAGTDKSGTFNVPAGGEATIQAKVFGFGPMTIRVTVGCIGKTLNCFLLGRLYIRR